MRWESALLKKESNLLLDLTIFIERNDPCLKQLINWPKGLGYFRLESLISQVQLQKVWTKDELI